ncbi:uncharacterized protein BJ171DRAFT_487894 [Polychytrium aggregatum]|uniref:uncharacterized protein n=1 Tax=Polychytrium aggregatum TaxID=110093 RepID=UPI0022FEAADD|nr:uncharacterized protein BJ171DRAFT_487894 [Polychytrium aggregatum]KAI9208946.1 hypothetical protein BJ171DRAFT_487894 [Polychytrium aggregatum]
MFAVFSITLHRLRQRLTPLCTFLAQRPPLPASSSTMPKFQSARCRHGPSPTCSVHHQGHPMHPPPSPWGIPKLSPAASSSVEANAGASSVPNTEHEGEPKAGAAFGASVGHHCVQHTLEQDIEQDIELDIELDIEPDAEQDAELDAEQDIEHDARHHFEASAGPDHDFFFVSPQPSSAAQMIPPQRRCDTVASSHPFDITDPSHRPAGCLLPSPTSPSPTPACAFPYPMSSLSSTPSLPPLAVTAPFVPLSAPPHNLVSPSLAPEAHDFSDAATLPSSLHCNSLAENHRPQPPSSLSPPSPGRERSVSPLPSFGSPSTEPLRPLRSCLKTVPRSTSRPVLSTPWGTLLSGSPASMPIDHDFTLIDPSEYLDEAPDPAPQQLPEDPWSPRVSFGSTVCVAHFHPLKDRPREILNEEYWECRPLSSPSDSSTPAGVIRRSSFSLESQLAAPSKRAIVLTY